MTGKNLTQTVIKAIKERLERERIKEQQTRKGIGTQLQQLADQCVALPLLDQCHPDKILYDEHGLAKRDSM
ncbi:MAG: type II toxin-antitoxin system VapB family antitoxin [Caldilineaceae bacterium]